MLSYMCKTGYHCWCEGVHCRCSLKMASSSSGTGENKILKNGFVKTKIICPEMCCYCFDILIGYIQNNSYTNSTMKNYFPNDE